MTSRNLLGDHISPPVPPQPDQTNPRISKDKHTNHPVVHPPQVPAILPLSVQTSTENRPGDPESVHSQCEGVL